MSDALRQGTSSSMSFNPTAAYVIANEPSAAEASDTIQYYGFVAHDGGWYIQKRDITTGNNYFATGSGNYTTAWTNKVSQTYNYFNVTFRSQQ